MAVAPPSVPTPPVLTPEELMRPNDGKEYPPVPGRDEVYTDKGQRLVRYIPKVKKAKALANTTETLTKEGWIDVLTEVVDDVLSVQGRTSTGWQGCFWHVDKGVLADMLVSRRVLFPADIRVLGVPFQAFVAMVLRFLVRVLPPKALRPTKVDTLLSKPYIHLVAPMILRGEEFCCEVLGLLDDLMIVDRVVPDHSLRWSDGRFDITNLLACTELRRRGYSIKRAALVGCIDILQRGSAPPLHYLAAAIVGVIARHPAFPASDEDWKLEVLAALGLPPTVQLPDRIRYGYVRKDYSQPGLRILRIAEQGQLVYADRFGKVTSEGVTLEMHPRVKAWGWNVQVFIDKTNYRYLLAQQIPEKCPWVWYQAWGNDQYDVNGKSHDRSRQVEWLAAV